MNISVKYLLLIWNSNLTELPVFLFAKPGNPPWTRGVEISLKLARDQISTAGTTNSIWPSGSYNEGVTVPPFTLASKEGENFGGESLYKWTTSSRISQCQHSAILDNGRNNHQCLLFFCWPRLTWLFFASSIPILQESHLSLLLNFIPLLS